MNEWYTDNKLEDDKLAVWLANLKKKTYKF